MDERQDLPLDFSFSMNQILQHCRQAERDWTARWILLDADKTLRRESQDMIECLRGDYLGVLLWRKQFFKGD